MTSEPIPDTRPLPVRKSRVMTFLMGLVVGVFLTLFVPYLWQARAEILRRDCAHNMKHILLALHSYHDQYGSFPPAYTVDDHGTKLHSWRVLILPQLGEDELYRQIRLDEPWNSDHNKRFQTQMPGVFCCPADRSKQKRGETSYVWLIGKGFISDGTSCTKLSEISDGTSNTLMLVETLHPICWTSPEDLTEEQCWTSVEGSLGAIGSNHRVAANLGFADGSVSPLEQFDIYTILRIATIAGGEQLVGL